MAAHFIKPDKTDTAQRQQSAKQRSDRTAKHQVDGSTVTSPSRDPVNSKETLRRNRIGNS
jgi:hypothetical protein